jgi:hypothetical protein
LLLCSEQVFARMADFDIGLLSLYSPVVGPIVAKLLAVMKTNKTNEMM